MTTVVSLTDEEVAEIQAATKQSDVAEALGLHCANTFVTHSARS